MKRTTLFNRTMNYISLNADFQGLVLKAISSGAIDVDAIEDDDYTAIKAIASAVFSEISDNLRPISREGKEMVKNIQKF